ncbi:uncharacterized protein LOC111366992 [Olea europaea var. sylvestris]|uniref:uncharacterized protein LOC111366992 n=1 Tax=Olea europaea var. sylvestris TaxID=158386 RepID=UPI000C1D828C|nr:uncharacterized protein LOC111366992 [Olea europaea var. sylvestris]
MLKKHLGVAPLLSKPQLEEPLLLYLAVLDEGISAILVREGNEHQLPVYYVSKALLPTETRYLDMEKLALALITASRKLRPYFQPTQLKWILKRGRLHEGHKLNCAVRFDFKALNNTAEYEALLAGLRLERKMQVRRLLASSNS